MLFMEKYFYVLNLLPSHTEDMRNIVLKRYRKEKLKIKWLVTAKLRPFQAKPFFNIYTYI